MGGHRPVPAQDVEGVVVSKYMVFYNTTSAMRAQLAEIPPEQAAAGMQDWMTWGERVGDRLVDMGSPLENDGDADVPVSGYAIVDADSQEQLDGLLEGHTRTRPLAGRSRRRSSWSFPACDPASATDQAGVCVRTGGIAPGPTRTGPTCRRPGSAWQAVPGIPTGNQRRRPCRARRRR